MDPLCDIIVVGKSLRQYFTLMKTLNSECSSFCTLNLQKLDFLVQAGDSVLGNYEVKFSSATTVFNFCRSSCEEFEITWRFDINAMIAGLKKLPTKSDVRLVFYRNQPTTLYISAQWDSTDIIFEPIYIEICEKTLDCSVFTYKRFSGNIDDPNVKITKDTMKVLKKQLTEITSPELQIYDQGAIVQSCSNSTIPKFVIGSVDFEDEEGKGNLPAKTLLINRQLKLIIDALATFPEKSFLKIYHQIGLPLFCNLDTYNGSVQFYLQV